MDNKDKFKKNKRSNYRKSKKKTNVKEVKEKEPMESYGIKGPINNDPDWYIYDRTMFDGVISMPTLDFKGVSSEWPIGEGNVEYGSGTYESKTLDAPTVIAYKMNPSAGYHGSDYVNSSINTAARKLYAELSASNAKTSNYAPQDIAFLILELGQIIAMTSHCRRMYGITNYFNFYNRAVPKAFMGLHNMSTEGINAWTSSMPELRSKLNAVISRINSIQFPANFNYFKKCEYVYNHIFVDRDDSMPTYQFMIPFNTWVLDETSYEGGTILKNTVVHSAGSAYTSPIEIVDILKGMVDKVLDSATFNYIFADVINLINRNVLDSNTITFDMIPIDYSVTPLYSEQFNWQIMNATICGNPNETTLSEDTTPFNDVYPDVDTNCIKYLPKWKTMNLGTNAIKERVYVYRSLPVRLPDTNISDDEFVELLAYHNEPSFEIEEVNNGFNLYRRFPGLSDFYLASVDMMSGNKVSFGDRNVMDTHFGFSVNASSWLPMVPKILNVVHTPIFGIIYSYKEYILSKLGAYTFVNTRAMRNLRFETFLGLFYYKK